MKKVVEDPTDPKSIAFNYNQQKAKRKDLQFEAEKKYEGLLVTLKDQIRFHESEDIKETMLQELRNDVLNFWNENQGNPPKFVDDLYKAKIREKPLTAEEEAIKQKEEEDKKKDKKKKAAAKKAGKGKKKGKATPVSIQSYEIILRIIKLSRPRGWESKKK